MEPYLVWAALALIALLAGRYGVDSQDGHDWTPRPYARHSPPVRPRRQAHRSPTARGAEPEVTKITPKVQDVPTP